MRNAELKFQACETTGALRVLRTAEELDGVRDAWAALARRPNADLDFFLTINAARENVERPHVIVLERTGAPGVILVGRIEQTELECRLGYRALARPCVRALTIVSGGVLGEPTPAEAALLIDEIYAALERGEADVARLAGLEPHSELFHCARRRPPFPWRDRLATCAPRWEIDLPATFDEFMMRLKGKRRGEMRRMERLFEKNFPDAECRIYTRPEEVGRLLEDAEAVARRTYQRGIGAGFVGDAEHRQRLELAAARGWLRAYVIYAGGAPVAFEIGTLYRDTFFLDYTGYDPALRKYEVGTLVFMKMIADVCGRAAKIDCGAGDAAYKEQFGDRRVEECTALMFAPTAREAWINFLRTMCGALNGAATAMARKLQLERRVKKFWRDKKCSSPSVSEG